MSVEIDLPSEIEQSPIERGEIGIPMPAALPAGRVTLAPTEQIDESLLVTGTVTSNSGSSRGYNRIVESEAPPAVKTRAVAVSIKEGEVLTVTETASVDEMPWADEAVSNEIAQLPVATGLKEICVNAPSRVYVGE